jgi:hypothetical protein
MNPTTKPTSVYPEIDFYAEAINGAIEVRAETQVRISRFNTYYLVLIRDSAILRNETNHILNTVELCQRLIKSAVFCQEFYKISELDETDPDQNSEHDRIKNILP